MKKFLKWLFFIMCIDSVSSSIFKGIANNTIKIKYLSQDQLSILVGVILIGFITIIILKSNKASKSKKQETMNMNSNTGLNNNKGCPCRCCQCCQMKSVNANM